MKGDLEWTLETGGAAISIIVEYTYGGGGPDYFAGGCWNPGDPVEIEITDVVCGEWTGPQIYKYRWDPLSLLPAEEERIIQHIAENPPEPDYGDDH